MHSISVITEVLIPSAAHVPCFLFTRNNSLYSLLTRVWCHIAETENKPYKEVVVAGEKGRYRKHRGGKKKENHRKTE